MKKVLWLTDHTIEDVPAGGAEITDSYVIQAGESLGYNISIVRPHQFKSADLKTDLVIISNNYEFPRPAINKVIDELPYIAYSHDCGRWKEVVRQHKDMFTKALGSIFLSPLHRDQFLPYLDGKNIYCVPPYMPLDFYDYGLIRNNKVIYAGNLFEGKGLYTVADFAAQNPKLQFDFYYKRSSKSVERRLKQLSNCNLIGYVPKEKLPEVLNKYSYFIHIPVDVEGFGRAATEAYLCGCEMFINDKVAAFSFDWDYQDFRNNTLNGHYYFWDCVEEILKNEK